ncbi:MAG: hypothetical protein HQ557_17595 [Bacteroidetes bacterium]|nr:hypothetical protein [Bacteroidota bacterium]
MYIPNTQLKSELLLQGDIVNDIHILGAVNPNSILITFSQEGRATQWSVNNPPTKGPAIVLSHSCEIAQENGMKLTSIILAPLRDINSATRPDKIQELKDSNYIDENNTSSFLKYFYLEATHEYGEMFPNGCVADFSKCFSLHKKAYRGLLNNKIIELTDDVRKYFSIKLALFYFRNN